MPGLMSSNWLDYQAFIERTFLGFLQEQGASHITQKNYRTDIRHFMGWVTGILDTHKEAEFDSQQQAVFKQLTADKLNEYKRSQLVAGTPASTVNRRLST